MRWNITNPTPPDLLALVCPVCGLPLEVASAAEVFPCLHCRRAYIAAEGSLAEIATQTATATTALAMPAEVRYLAVWRFLAAVEVREKRSETVVAPSAVWEQIRRVAAPLPAFLYVPAFTFARMAVQQLGVGLVRAQPNLVLEPGLPAERVSLHRTGGERGDESEGPGFGPVSPVLLSAADAGTVAHFVYLAVEARATAGLRAIDYDLGLSGGELLLIPAVYDRRYARDSFWRFLLREFDGLVA